MNIYEARDIVAGIGEIRIDDTARAMCKKVLDIEKTEREITELQTRIMEKKRGNSFLLAEIKATLQSEYPLDELSEALYRGKKSESIQNELDAAKAGKKMYKHVGPYGGRRRIHELLIVEKKPLDNSRLL